MTEAAAAAWAQVLGLGTIWVGVHCAGMCGTLLVGLDVAGVTRGRSAVQGVGSVLLYQTGRALTYAALGALAGTAGAGLGATFAAAGSWVALAMAVLLIVAIVRRRVGTTGRPRPVTLGRKHAPSLVDRLTHAVLPLVGRGGPINLLALGAVLGFLPCMITVWALGLAATTGSPLHGAGMLVALVGLTTPALLGVTLLPRLLAGRLRGLAAHAPAVLMGVSAIWLGMVGLAGLGVVDHVHVPIGGDLVVMLW